MTSKNLLEQLRLLGLPFFEVEEAVNANLVLADVVRSRNMRFWEGFPVLLANSARRGIFDYTKVKSELKNPSDRKAFISLVLVSLALYKFIGLKFLWADKLHKYFSLKEKKILRDYWEDIKSGYSLSIGDKSLSAERMISIFNSYFQRTEEELSDLISVKDEFSFERALSCLFSPKQKELFLKKVRREKLTKTEREYYSRVVKKKVMALANERLHRLAQKLLEE